MMDCQEVHKFVHAYVDGEFGEEDRIAFAAHLQGCESCRRVVRFEEAFKEKLRASRSEEVAPARLRARVESLLADEAAREDRRRHRRWVYRWAPAFAAAAVVTVLLGVGIQGRLFRSRAVAPDEEIAEQTVRWHRTALPMDVVDSKGEAIQRFFRDKVPFAVRLPRVHSANAHLVGARLTQLRGKRAVYLTYQVGGQRVSFFVVDPRTLSSRRLHWRGVKGYNVGTYVSDGTGYAVTSAMDKKRLVRLVSDDD